MKNILSILLILTMAFSFGGCATADNAELQTIQAPAKTEIAAEPTINTMSVVAQEAASSKKSIADSTPSTEVASSKSEPACTISGGGYVVDVMKAEIAKDGLGNDCIAIRFKFTNNNSYEMAFAFIAMETVQQAGQNLTVDGMVINGSDASQTNLCQWISNGQSIDVTYIYPYNSNEDINFSMNIVKDLNSITPLASGSCILSLQ